MSLNTLPEFLREILDTRSMECIQYDVNRRIEELCRLQRMDCPVRYEHQDEIDMLTALINTRSLDEMRARCHDALGEHEQARQLREWDRNRGARRARSEAHLQEILA